jgi:hypothetical protein
LRGFAICTSCCGEGPRKLVMGRPLCAIGLSIVAITGNGRQCRIRFILDGINLHSKYFKTKFQVESVKLDGVGVN